MRPERGCFVAVSGLENWTEVRNFCGESGSGVSGERERERDRQTETPGSGGRIDRQIDRDRRNKLHFLKFTMDLFNDSDKMDNRPPLSLFVSFALFFFSLFIYCVNKNCMMSIEICKATFRLME